MASSSTNTLLRTMEFCKKLNFGRRSALGNFLEPAITSANTVMQTVLGAPFAWRWNRVVTGFITTAGQQDYTLINWAPGLNVQLGWLTVDVNGNSQVVTTAAGTGVVPPTFNPVKGGTTNDNDVVWTNLGPVGVAVSTNYSFGWIETASVQETTTAGNSKWFEVTSELCLASDSAEDRPRFISAQGDNGSGAITFRLMPVPDTAYPVAITLQQKPPLFTSLSQTWAPIPDEYAHIYNWGFLSLMWLFADDPRFPTANQKFVTQLLSAQEGLSETQRNIFLQGWQQNTGQSVSNADRMSQGYQARGT
jgi:hypothetical protein